MQENKLFLELKNTEKKVWANMWNDFFWFYPPIRCTLMQIVCFKVQYSIYFTVHIYGVQIMDILDNPRAPSGVYLCVIITHPIWRFLTKEKIRATFQEGRAGGIIGRFIVLLSSSIIVLLSIIEHCWRNRCTSPQFVYFICLLYFWSHV